MFVSERQLFQVLQPLSRCAFYSKFIRQFPVTCVQDETLAEIDNVIWL